MRAAVGILFAALVAAAPAAAETNTYTFTVRGQVPVICRHEMAASIHQVSQQTADLGAVRQFCNNPAGYRFVATHGPEFSGRFVVDGRVIPAAPSGTTVLEDRRGPAAKDMSLQIETGPDAGTVNLSLAMIAN